MELVERIQVLVKDEGLVDALYFTPEERAALSDADVEALGQQRVDNHKAMLAAPRAPEPEKTSEQLDAELEALTQEAERLAGVITAKQVERTVLAEKVAQPVRK